MNTTGLYLKHIKQTGAGSKQSTMDGWKQLMGDGLIIVDNKNDVARIIAETIIKTQPLKVQVKEEAIIVKPNIIL